MQNSLYQALLQLSNPAKIPGLSRFFKTGPGEYGEGDRFWGISVPLIRKTVKECVNGAPAPEDFDSLLHHPVHEVRLAALLALVRLFETNRRDEKYGQSLVDYYLANTAYINNWDLVDLSCYALLGAWLLPRPREREVLYRLAQSSLLWDQRIAIVSTMAFVRAGDCQDTCLLAQGLLHHPHDLMHKATGWLLREVGKKEPETLRRFLATRYKQMPRTMLRYAIEKFPEAERKAYLAGRI